MSNGAFVAPLPASTVRYQDHIGSLSRSDKTPQRILSQSTRIHILRDKLDPRRVEELENLAQSLGAQVTTVAEAANVVVTVLKAPKRILKWFHDGEVNVVPRRGEQGVKMEAVEKKLGEGVGRDWRRFVVTEEWLEVVRSEGTLVDPDLYAAVKFNEEEEEEDVQAEAVGADRKRKRSPSDSPLLATSHTSKPPKIRRKISPSPANTSSPTTSAYYDPVYPPSNCPRWQNTRYACRRPSPLVSRNQALIAELETIRNERRLTGDTYSEMAYMRAISALKAFPMPIPDPVLDPPDVFDASLLEVRLGEVEKLKGVGKKVLSLVRQFYSSSSRRERIVEAKIIKRDKAMYIINAFTELYGIGPIGAREAYNSGARSFADVLHRGKSLATHLSAKESVRILSDLRQPIGRQECRTITEQIMKLVRSVLAEGIEVKYEICGGYRRGKESMFDLDVIIGHTEAASRGLHMRLLDEMKRKGLVSHIVNVSTPAPSFAETSQAAVHIDIANIVVLPTGVERPIHRRVDLVFCPLRVYGATVLGWTGSLTFERDLRLWSKSKGFNFSFDGLTNLAEECLVETKSEQDVFDALGLEWVPPEWRNCDA